MRHQFNAGIPLFTVIVTVAVLKRRRQSRVLLLALSGQLPASSLWQLSHQRAAGPLGPHARQDGGFRWDRPWRCLPSGHRAGRDRHEQAPGRHHRSGPQLRQQGRGHLHHHQRCVRGGAWCRGGNAAISILWRLYGWTAFHARRFFAPAPLLGSDSGSARLSVHTLTPCALGDSVQAPASSWMAPIHGWCSAALCVACAASHAAECPLAGHLCAH